MRKSNLKVALSYGSAFVLFPLHSNHYSQTGRLPQREQSLNPGFSNISLDLPNPGCGRGWTGRFLGTEEKDEKELTRHV